MPNRIHPRLFAEVDLPARCVIDMNEEHDEFTPPEIVVTTTGRTMVLAAPYGRRRRFRLSNSGDFVLPIPEDEFPLGRRLEFWSTRRRTGFLTPANYWLQTLDREPVPDSIAGEDAETGAPVPIVLNYYNGKVGLSAEVPEGTILVSWRPRYGVVVTKAPDGSADATGPSQGWDMELTEEYGR